MIKIHKNIKHFCTNLHSCAIFFLVINSVPLAPDHCEKILQATTHGYSWWVWSVLIRLGCLTRLYCTSDYSLLTRSHAKYPWYMCVAINLWWHRPKKKDNLLTSDALLDLLDIFSKGGLRLNFSTNCSGKCISAGNDNRFEISCTKQKKYSSYWLMLTENIYCYESW